MSDIQPQTKWNLNTFAFANEHKLPGFKKLLNSWLNVHRNFCDGAQPDFSWDWGYHERPQIGLLSNAAILIGGLSIEEGWIQKESDEGKKYSGRCDLWLRLSPPTSEHDYLIEAKHEYLWIKSGLHNSCQVIDQQMAAARVSAQCLKKSEKIVAIAFLSLSFEDKGLETIERRTDELIAHIRDQGQCKEDFDAVGAIWMGAKEFERSRQERERDHPGWENRHFGMILLASRIMT